ncbi:MAG: CDP-alcohol phosphatidyltransferase family protein [Erythrobacter sp.]
MLDARLRPLIDTPLNAMGRGIARAGMSANGVTMVGMMLGIGAGFSIAHNAFWWGLALVLANRLLDGLDGAVARASGQTDFGGYLDIVADFVFYIAVPVGFGFAAVHNQFPALVLVASFTLTGISFLAFATIAAKRGAETSDHGQKSFFYSTGIAEGAETIVAFVVMCLWPEHFPFIAFAYSAICVLTVLQRSMLARATFRD